ncbi:transposase [Streptomyces brevispora]|uniref:transposase n=1 Tax=Streptomyces brevispora TaxID=887462 RepID=UPI002E322FE0|nr:transposase [Streptomyces brevispora]
MRPAEANAEQLSTWITTAQAEDVPHRHAFARGLERDRAAANAALTRAYHNGGTEGVNNKTKLMSSSRGHFSPRPSQNRT